MIGSRFPNKRIGLRGTAKFGIAMRYLASIFVAVSFAAVADTPGDYIGQTKSGVEFRIVTDGASYVGDRQQFLKPEYIEMYRLKKRGNLFIPFDQRTLPSNCVISAEEVDAEILLCEKNSDTPLSGVRYELNKTRFKERGVVELRCVLGCTDLIPATFVYQSQMGFVP